MDQHLRTSMGRPEASHALTANYPSVRENDKNHQNSETEAPEKGINY